MNVAIGRLGGAGQQWATVGEGTWHATSGNRAILAGQPPGTEYYIIEDKLCVAH